MKRGKIGVCVIGSGRAGMIHARNYVRGIPGAELVALADSREDMVREACAELELEKSFLEYREALKDDAVGAVVVATPTVFHRDIVVAAARAGKHVFCEKPMAMNVAECSEMIEAAERAGVNLQIGFMRRFDAGFQQARKQIADGEIGQVVLVKSLTRGPSVPQPWMYDIAASNGPLAEVNSHDIDTLHWFTGSEFREVYAIAGNYRCPEARAEHPDFYDNVVLTASFANGAQGVIDGAVSVGYGYDARVEVLGTDGVLFIGQIEDLPVAVCARDQKVVRRSVWSWRGLFTDAYRAEDESFIAAIREERPPEVTGVDGRRAVQVVNAGNRSIAERRPVVLDEVRA
ncbi:MAG: Gfo/Idh/MocA family oxidoreductase [Spirochaetales bacterium]|nr:Gfo/Idh/MocA family oxidoreductase [Spirochaetales bacterium]